MSNEDPYKEYRIPSMIRVYATTSLYDGPEVVIEVEGIGPNEHAARRLDIEEAEALARVLDATAAMARGIK